MSKEEKFRQEGRGSRPAQGGRDRGERPGSRPTQGWRDREEGRGTKPAQARGGREERRDSKPAQGGREREERPGAKRAGWVERPKQSLSEEIIGLDEELLRLLSKRSALMGKLRKGKAHAATPAIVRSEKQIRGAWEDAATRLGGGARLSRQLFSLLQDINIAPAQGEAYSPFNLSPLRQPVEIDSPGPALSLSAQLWLALAVSSGKALALYNAPRSAALMDLVHAFEQCGVKLQWQGNVLLLEGKSRPDYYGKTIFVGDDLMTFYIFVFLGLVSPGKLRLSGGSALKEADLTWLTRFLPTLGARMTSTLPGSKGLPVTLECSAVLPEEFSIPSAFSLEASLALLLGNTARKHKVSVSLGELPAQLLKLLQDGSRRVFNYVPGMGQTLDNSLEINGYAIADLDFPASVHMPLDPSLSAYLLALPIFTGGRVSLNGRVVRFPSFDAFTALAAKCGLEVKMTESSVSSRMLPEAAWPPVLEEKTLQPELQPLFWLLNARLCYKAKTTLGIRAYPAGADLEQATDFLEQLGCRLEQSTDGLKLSLLSAEDFKLVAAKNYGWSCPGPFWGLALSLGAYLRSNLKISNPDCVNKVLPGYWKFYNKLPASKLHFTEESSPSAASPEPSSSTRRRIRTNTVIEPELPEDSPEGDGFAGKPDDQGGV